MRHWEASENKRLTLDRPRLLAIVNATPDSFSDGGKHLAVDDALRFGERSLEAGADGIDVGGESTRPGAHPVSEAEQIARALPIIERLRATLGDSFVITVDTTRAGVARAALDAGADSVNDVSAGTDDEAMLPLIGARGAGVILMHRLRQPISDQYSTAYRAAPEYGPAGVVNVVREYLRDRADAALAAGVRPSRIMVDPGLGFGKTVEQNLELIRGTRAIAELGYPVLSALSRKSFTGVASGLKASAPIEARVSGTLGLSAGHLAHGASVFRVHDVEEHVRVLSAMWRTLGG